MRTLAIFAAASLALAGCGGGPETSLWICAGQSDLILTQDEMTLTITNVDSGASIDLTETEENRAWGSGNIFWRVVGLDHAIYQTEDSRVLNCRRPG